MSDDSPDEPLDGRYARIPCPANVQVHEVPETGEAVLQDLERGTILVVNPIGSAIFTLVDGSRSVGEIVEFVAETLDVPRATVEGDVGAFLDQLVESGLVGWSEP